MGRPARRFLLLSRKEMVAAWTGMVAAGVKSRGCSRDKFRNS